MGEQVNKSIALKHQTCSSHKLCPVITFYVTCKTPLTHADQSPKFFYSVLSPSELLPAIGRLQNTRKCPQSYCSLDRRAGTHSAGLSLRQSNFDLENQKSNNDVHLI